MDRIALIFAVFIPLAFLVLGVLRAWPFFDDVPLDGASGDDWLQYKIYADSILHGGLSIPAIHGPYLAPRGFFYNYFVAGVFALFGENSSYVYVVQSFLVGLSASLLYVIARTRMSRLGAFAVLLGATAYVYVDFFRALTFRLLSENLYIFLLPAFLLLSLSSLNDRSVPKAAGAGICLGLVTLTRPTALAGGLAALAIAAAYSLKERASAHRVLLTVFLLFALTMSLLPLRDFAATGRPGFDLITYSSDWGRPPTDSPQSFLEFYARRGLFTVGFTSAYGGTDYRWRPHWMLLWLGLLVALVASIRARRLPEMWELVCLSFVLLHIVPVTIFADIVSYGGRLVAMIMPLLLLVVVARVDNLAVRRVDELDHYRWVLARRARS